MQLEEPLSNCLIDSFLMYAILLFREKYYFVLRRIKSKLFELFSILDNFIIDGIRVTSHALTVDNTSNP